MGDVLEASAREPNRKSLIDLMAKARACGVLQSGEPQSIAGQFYSLLMGDLIVRLMLGTAAPPGPEEIRQRAEAATDAILVLYAPAADVRAAAPHRPS